MIRKSFFNLSNIQLILVMIVLITVCFVIYFLVSSPNPGDIAEKAIAIEIKRIEKELSETRQNSETISREISSLRDEIDEVRRELAESVKQREESHDAINNAGSITAIDNILDKNKRR